jgi:hypothetical protein
MSLLFSSEGSANQGTDRWFRVMAVAIEEGANSGLDTFTQQLGSTDFFTNGSIQYLLSIPEPTKCSIFHDQVIKPVSDGRLAGSTTFRTFKLDLQLFKNKVMDYNSPTSNYSAKKNYYLLIIPFELGGLSASTVVGRIMYESVVDFTD